MSEKGKKQVEISRILMKNWNGTKEQIENLCNLTYPDGSKILTRNDILMEVIVSSEKFYHQLIINNCLN